MDLEAERRYQRSAVTASFILAGVAAVFASKAFPFFSRAEDGLFLAVNLAVLLGIAYLPPLLQSSPAFLVRSIVWQVKARWLLLLAAIAYWSAIVRPDGARRFLPAATWLAAISLAAYAAGRRGWHAHEIAWTLLFAGDLAVLVYAISALEATLTLAVLAGVSAFLLIATSGRGPRAALAFVAGIYLGLLYGGMGWLRWYAIAWFAVLALAVWWLTKLAAPVTAVHPPAPPQQTLPFTDIPRAEPPQEPAAGNSSGTSES